MSVTITYVTVTHRYLMNKSKQDLIWWLEDQARAGWPTLPDPESWTKDQLASQIMRNIRLQEARDWYAQQDAIASLPAQLLAAGVHA